MGKQRLSNFILYRWRYVLAYVAFGIALASLLVVAGLFIPGGLNDSEIQSALISNQLNPSLLFSLKPEQLVYLPYLLLQASSIALLGFDAFSIKLPSLILAFLSAGGLLMLFNLWFTRNVAIIASIMAVTTTQFILTAQSGQAGITYIFLTISILLAASLIARKGTLPNAWVIIGFALAALSLYMPLNIYVLIALVLTALLHPHARHTIVREASRPLLAIGILIFVIIISPLVIGIVNEPSLLRQLLGIPSDWSMIGENAKILFSQYASFSTSSSGSTITPVYGLGSILLILLGLYRMFTTNYTTKSYIISFWLVLLVPFVFLNPEFISITFVPVMLLLALGIDYIIWSWYRLFPRNPYARVFGLLPLAVLVVGMGVANIDRYTYGFHYDARIYSDYNFDLGLLRKTLEESDNSATIQLVVSETDLPLYKAYAQHQTAIREVIVSSDAATALTSQQPTLIARNAMSTVSAIPDEVIVSSTADKADRFYLYKNGTN